MTTKYILETSLGQVLGLLLPQNRLIIEVMLHTGLRVSDVLSIRADQIKPRFWIKESKTGKSKMVGLPQELRQRIMSQTVPGNPYAFPGRRPGKHKTRQAVWHDIKRAQRALRMDVNVGTHSARKVYAVRLLSKYGSIEKVQQALNHSDPSITVIYAMADKLIETGPGAIKQRRGTRYGR